MELAEIMLVNGVRSGVNGKKPRYMRVVAAAHALGVAMKPLVLLSTKMATTTATATSIANGCVSQKQKATRESHKTSIEKLSAPVGMLNALFRL